MINIPDTVLFDIVRHSIKVYIESGKVAKFYNLLSVYPVLGEKLGSFVTLYIKKELNGCVGRIEGENNLAEDLTVNAIDAAFNDNRFIPVNKNCLPDMKVEVSILTQPQVLKFKEVRELFQILNRDKPGVIIEYSGEKSTYLPQVWESYDSPEIFMEELALKGGFDKNIWKLPGCVIKTYQAQIFEEK